MFHETGRGLPGNDTDARGILGLEGVADAVRPDGPAEKKRDRSGSGNLGISRGMTPLGVGLLPTSAGGLTGVSVTGTTPLMPGVTPVFTTIGAERRRGNLELPPLFDAPPLGLPESDVVLFVGFISRGRNGAVGLVFVRPVSC